MNMRGTQEGEINQYLADTIASVFETVYTVDVTGSTNRELFASKSPYLLEAMQDNVALAPDTRLADLMDRVSEGMTAYEPGDYLMTDDRAPVELLGMRVIDEIIREEVEYYRGIFERDGIRGLLEQM